MDSTVMTNLQTFHLLTALALARLFVKISGSTSPALVFTGPDMAYLGSRVAFRCVVPDSPLPVNYKLIGDSGVVIPMGLYPQGGQPASYFLKVNATSEGSYHCRATMRGSTELSDTIKLSVITPPSNTRLISEPFPPTVYEGSRIVLRCTAKGSHLSYTWFFKRKEVTSSNVPLLHLVGNKLVMEEVTPEHAGPYSCLAWSTVKDIKRFSSSSEVDVTVKVYVSKPQIAFSISKEGASYAGNVSCWSTRGSPPLNFSLLLDDKEVRTVTATEALDAWFLVAVVPGLDSGVAQCRVKTEVEELMSDPVSLEVVPVGGDIKVEVEYLYTADSKLAAARLSCQLRRGTFPYISWLFNDLVLSSETHQDDQIQPDLTHYAIADHRRTLVLPMVTPKESGYYRCRARDSYNESGTWVESSAVLVRVTDGIANSKPRATSPTETPPKVLFSAIEVIAITFCCFLFLTLAVCAAFVYRMFSDEQAQAQMSSTNSGALPLSATTHQSVGIQAHPSFTACDVQTQISEITV